MEQHLFIVKDNVGHTYRFPITSVVFVREQGKTVTVAMKNGIAIILNDEWALEFLGEYNSHFVGVA